MGEARGGGGTGLHFRSLRRDASANQSADRIRIPQAHTYGPRLIHLGLAILSGQTVPPYNYVEHKLVPAVTARVPSPYLVTPLATVFQ